MQFGFKKYLVLVLFGLNMSFFTVPASAAGAGHSCGGFLGPICDAGLVCDQLPNMCGRFNALGRCVRVQPGCFRIYKPVCGCDGVTYGNDCERLHAKTQLAHAGACKKR
jgi:hypothetical protein